MGPKGASENGNIATIARRVPASGVVNALPPRRGKLKPPREPRTPPVVETLRRALEWRRELDAGEVASQAAIARREGVTRARVTQVLMLLRLAPDIQERMLSMPRSPNPPRISERVLRPITRIQDPEEQAVVFAGAIDHLS